MPILTYNSYSNPAFEGEVPHKEYGAVFAGIENQIINRSDLVTTYGGFNSSSIIPYGRFVYRVSSTSTTNESSINVALPGNAALATPVVLGVAVGSYTREKRFTANSNTAPLNSNIQLEEGYLPFEPITILRSGLVWVYSETALAVGATVFIRASLPTANTNQAYGRVRNALATANDPSFNSSTNPAIRVVRPCTNAAGGFTLLDIDFKANPVTA